MTHSKCGLLLLLAAAGAVACGGDPTSSFREGNERIVATPSSLFLNQGAQIFVVTELQDAQGNQLDATFDPTDVGSEITVERDSTFLETTNGTTLKTRERFIVTGVSPGLTSFTVRSGSVSLAVSVRVIPTSIAATFSNAAPAPNEPVIITLPSGFAFHADATVESDLGPGVVLSFSADSTSISALIPPSSTGPLTLGGFGAAFLPGLSLTLATADPITAAASVGTESTGTAPSVPVPAAAGDSTIFLGGGAFSGADITGDGGSGAQYFKVTVTQAGDYKFVTGWANDADVDNVVCFDANCATADFSGASSSNPETSSVTLTPGTYYLCVVLFAGTAPGSFSVKILNVPPAVP
jgi:hypothetical protein